MTDAAPRILDLLDYIEQVEKLKAKPAFSVPTEFFHAYQHELQSLPEVQYDLQSEGDEVWLRLPRLQEIAPPELDEKLKPWVTLPKSPEKTPELKLAPAGENAPHDAEHAAIKELFAWYVEYQWEPWAAAEAPRRKTIARYNKLFSLQQAIASDGAEAPLELVWGIGNAAWKKTGFATAVTHPLLVQQCEVVLNEQTFELEVRPRNVDPRIELDCYAEMEIPGVTQLSAFWKSSLANGASRPNPFDDSTFEGVLKAAVGHLDPSGGYEVSDTSAVPPSPTDKLKITNTWVLFARKRSGDLFIEDIRRLKKSVAEANEIPGVLRSFVEHGESTVRIRPERPFRGLSSSESPQGALELYFPMPYNDEQVSIIKKLEDNDGVVVQGPPGTGKTHTIANVICHYLAQGKRVLVTAKGESALAVLRDKLPEQIRPLSVALLSDERDGMRRFEHSIQTIASSVAALDPSRALARITAAEGKLNQLHAEIAHVDQTVASYAAKHMHSYSFQGKSVTPGEMAKMVMAEADEHQWFDDSPPSSGDTGLPFGDGDVCSLRKARKSVGADLSYLEHALPQANEFPDWLSLQALHRDLARAAAIESNVSAGSLLDLADSTHDTLVKAQALGSFLEERMALASELSGRKQPWLLELTSRLGEMEPDDAVLVALLTCGQDIHQLEVERRALLPKAISVPDGAEVDAEFNEALGRLTDGRGAFTLPFGRAKARALVKAVTVLGAAPTGVEGWAVAAQLVDWRQRACSVIARWNAIAPEFGFELFRAEPDASFKRMAQVQTEVEMARRLALDYDAGIHGRLSEVFGSRTADRVWSEGDAFLSACALSLQAHTEHRRLVSASKQIDSLLQRLEGMSGPVVTELESFFSKALGKVSDIAGLENTWRILQSDLGRLNGLRPGLDEIARVSGLFAQAGATLWATRVRTALCAADHDPAVRSTWLEAWNWRQAVMFLERIDGYNTLRECFEKRRKLTLDLAKTYQELIAEKTWLGVFNNSPDNVRQALQAYLVAVQSMGAGTGVRAIRYRKNAQEAMRRAYQAVPCWVLPQWRVSETIPPEVGLFDLVVIDEASQSDIWALPAILRGKKLLVVGDQNQVSPSAVGTAEVRIKALITRFLGNQPHGAQMTPDKSIYDLARVVFAGNSVMLKEHFRSVPAIIEFSNREFYEGDIRPLRLPSAAERLDPPLIDVFVKGGYRKGDTNPVEAKAIVDEIELILADERLAHRTIGVVTLLGTEQAAHIHELISNRISPVDVLERKIEVGPPPVFQGKERDIMLVSMVLGTKDRAAANRDDMRQRFNVAMSRARDRMYLFRSVSDTHFREDTLNGKVIRHFKQPFHQDPRKVQARRERCESAFEVEVFDELVKRGFRVEPQVPCGGYRMDFVVEGAEGRRLAIECDGDRFHGPGQWGDDMARQRVLERAGWTFWRCFASSFVRRRKEVVDDLLATLARLGIEPLGAESEDTSEWVHSKTVDPFGVDDNEQEAA